MEFNVSFHLYIYQFQVLLIHVHYNISKNCQEEFLIFSFF